MQRTSRPKLGLALGSGSARGFAHIGVLQVFEEEGIPVDILAGTSMGALIGGIYVTGTDLGLLKGLALHLRWEHLIEISIPRKGLIIGSKIIDLIKLLTKNKTFSEASIPFAVIATDIERGEEVILKEGLLAEAIRASISIPGIFTPYTLNGKLLVDGALLNSIPVTVLRDMGADIVIGVNIGGGHAIKNKVSNIFEIIIQSVDIMQSELIKKKIFEADVLISPKIKDIGPTQFEKAGILIEYGRKATKKELPKIKELLTTKI